MTNVSKNEKRYGNVHGADSDPMRAGAEPSSTATRRPYVVPRLRCLGSVRELTLGSGLNAPDGEGTSQP
jgi:hypothetical protein